MIKSLIKWILIHCVSAVAIVIHLLPGPNRHARRTRSLWAGSPIINMAVNARAERLLGVDADSLVYETYYITDAFTYDLSRWRRLPMVGFLLPWIAVWGACRALGAASSVLFQAIGKPAYATVFQFFMLILFAAVVIPSANIWGMHGVVYSLVGIGVTAQVARTLFLLQFVALSIAQILLRASVAIGCGIAAAGLTYLLLTLLPNDRGLLEKLDQ